MARVVAPGGGTLTIVGSVASPTTGTVQVAWNEAPYSGTAGFGGGGAGNDVRLQLGDKANRAERMQLGSA